MPYPQNCTKDVCKLKQSAYHRHNRNQDSKLYSTDLVSLKIHNKTISIGFNKEMCTAE